MRFLYLAIHHPSPEHALELLSAMKALGHAMSAADGLIEAAAWQEQGGKRIVAASVWESAAAFQKAATLIAGSIKDVPFGAWEERPRELFRLDEIP